MNKAIERALSLYKPGMNPEQALLDLENDMEIALLTFLPDLGIQAQIKQDKKSLPYQKELIMKRPYESYINSIFDYKKMFRQIAIELIKNDVTKIRFYTDIEAVDSHINVIPGFVKYKFRYYIHS